MKEVSRVNYKSGDLLYECLAETRLTVYRRLEISLSCSSQICMEVIKCQNENVAEKFYWLAVFLKANAPTDLLKISRSFQKQ